MRKKEQRLWDRTQKHIGVELNLVRVENPLMKGFPDVVFPRGVIELKAAETIPPRATTPLLGRDGLSVEQRNFIRDWIRKGGRAWVLVGVGSYHEAEQFLIEGSRFDAINSLPYDVIKSTALASDWHGIMMELSGNLGHRYLRNLKV